MSETIEVEKPQSIPSPPPVLTPTVNLTLPGSIIPMAGANAMLLVGSNKNNCDCSFPLHWFLVVGGAVGLCLVIMDVLAQYIVDWILEDSKINRVEKYVLLSTKILGFALTLVQVSALIGGSYLILSTIHNVDFDQDGQLTKECLANTENYHQKRDGMWRFNEDTEAVYCDYSMYMFTACLVSMTWFFLLLGLICFIYIWFGVQSHQESKKIIKSKEKA